MIFSTWWPETLISPFEIPTTSLPAVNFVYCLTSTWRSERDYKTGLNKAGSFIKVRDLDFCLQTSKPKFLVYSKYKLKISSAKRLASTPPAPGTTWKWSIDTEHQFCSTLASWPLYNRILLIIFFWRDKQLTDLPYQFTEGLIHLISTLKIDLGEYLWFNLTLSKSASTNFFISSPSSWASSCNSSCSSIQLDILDRGYESTSKYPIKIPFQYRVQVNQLALTTTKVALLHILFQVLKEARRYSRRWWRHTWTTQPSERLSRYSSTHIWQPTYTLKHH